MSEKHPNRLEWLLPYAFAALMVLSFWAIGHEFLRGYHLDLGASLNAPTPGFGRFLALWMFFASLAAAALASATTRSLEGAPMACLIASWQASAERKWVIYGSLFAFLIPAVLRTWVLRGAPLTDDESAYRFMAQVLASGGLFADSPPLKLFFDNRFMINDGKLYAHYFLGWPALMVPGVWLGATGFMNAAYSAATLPALWGVARRLLGASWAKLGVVLYLGSPMLMLAAATETAHTSCVFALAWMTWFWLKSREARAPWWSHGGLALFFSIAFCNRPTSALGIGLPFLLAWLWALRPGGPTVAKRQALVAFVVPTLALATLFLMVNKEQTGSWFEVAYQRAYTYATENDFRFSLWPAAIEDEGFTELRLDSPGRSLAVSGAALFRFNVTFLGWPCSLLFAFFAWRSRRLRMWWLSVASYFVFHLVTDNVGIDTFAPMHYFEVAWPFLVLNLGGLALLSREGQRLDRLQAATDGGAHRGRRGALPAALALALIAIGLVTYVPVRFSTIHRLADNILMPWTALTEADIERAVIFAPEPFIVYCQSAPTRGWVFVRPNNDPKLLNDLLWVNHLSLERNRQLMERFADRRGYVMVWDRSCRVVYLPLDQLQPGSVPDAKLPHFGDLDG